MGKIRGSNSALVTDACAAALRAEDRMADKDQPQRGGSRNRYLFRTSNGNTPSRDGRFRLYKLADAKHAGWEKTGPTHPDPAVIALEYKHLLDWYKREYAPST